MGTGVFLPRVREDFKDCWDDLEVEREEVMSG